jgi:hypothetical protein
MDFNKRLFAAWIDFVALSLKSRFVEEKSQEFALPGKFCGDKQVLFTNSVFTLI